MLVDMVPADDERLGPWPSREAYERPAVEPASRDPKALASFVLGVVSLALFGLFLTGIPAVLLGALSLRDRARARSTTSPRLAIAGAVMGGLGTALTGVVAVGALASMLLDPTRDALSGSTVAREDPRDPWPAHPGVHAQGAFAIVDPKEHERLGPQLESIVEVASRHDRIVLLYTCTRSNPMCMQLAQALTDPRFGRALDETVLVRIDVDEYDDAELRALRLETDTLPWFYRLDGRGQIQDALSGEEWPSPSPSNVAPILGSFARGTLRSRRTPSPLGVAL